MKADTVRRNEAIRAARAQGLTLREVGALFELSYERVRQICHWRIIERERSA